MNLLFVGLICATIFTVGMQRPIVARSIQNATPSSQHTLEQLDITKLKALIRNRKGRALFINVWATWCQPCVEEFPDIVKLAAAYKDRKIDFVGVSGDDANDEQSKVLPFIRYQKALFKFYIAELEGQDAFINAFNPQWEGGIPATFTFDASGHLKGFLVGKQSYQHLEEAVRKALGR